MRERDETRQMLSMKIIVEQDKSLESTQTGRHVPGPLTRTREGLLRKTMKKLSMNESRVEGTAETND